MSGPVFDFDTTGGRGQAQPSPKPDEQIRAEVAANEKLIETYKRLKSAKREASQTVAARTWLEQQRPDQFHSPDVNSWIANDMAASESEDSWRRGNHAKWSEGEAMHRANLADQSRWFRQELKGMAPGERVGPIRDTSGVPDLGNIFSKGKSGAGSEVGQLLGSFGGKLLGAAAAVTAFKSTVESITSMQRAAGSANESLGDLRLRAGKAAAALGLGDKTVAAMMEPGGQSTVQGNIALMERIAQHSRTRAGGYLPVKAEDALGALATYKATGAEEIGDAFGDPISFGSAKTAVRMALARSIGRGGRQVSSADYREAIGRDARRELATRAVLSGIENEKLQIQDVGGILLGSGAVNRIGKALQEKAMAGSPIMSGVLNASDAITMGTSGAITNRIAAGSSDAIVKAIERQTESLRPPTRRPAVRPGAGGEDSR